MHATSIPSLTAKPHMRKSGRSFAHGMRMTTLTLLLLLFASPANAKDLLYWVIEAVEPTLHPTRPLIECLAGGGSAAVCATEAAKQQASSTLPIGPEDTRIQTIVAVFEAARKEQWLEVVKRGSEAVAKTIACAVLPVQGPAKQPACNIIGWVVTNNVGMIDKAYDALKGPDWWAVVELLGPGVCQFIPGDGAAGAAKDVVCGVFGEVLRTAQRVAEEVQNAIVAGADAVENLLFGDDSHMPYDRYYALYWQPWYQYAVALSLDDQSLGSLNSRIWHPCVDYFDSHNQYRSTARKTCDDMRDKRFNPEAHAFARAMPVAVKGYFDTIAKPAIRAAVLASYGSESTGDLPGQNFFIQNCEFQIRKRFPFPEPDDARCKILEDAGQYGMFGPLFKELAKQCFADVKMQNIQPTIWRRACESMKPDYQREFATESLRLIVQLGQLKKKGCLAPSKEEAAKNGLLVTCNNYVGHAQCLSVFQNDGKKYCSADVEPIQINMPGSKKVIPLPGSQEKIQIPKPGSTPSGMRKPEKKIQLPQDKPAIKIPLPEKKPMLKLPSSIGSSKKEKKPAETIKPVKPGAIHLKPIPPLSIEAESLTTRGKSLVRGGQTRSQSMARFGKTWSASKQLFWSGGKTNSTLDLHVNVSGAGKWSIELYMTKAPDYGKLRFHVNGQSVRQSFDGYAKNVAGPFRVKLGTFALKKGRNTIRATIAGRNKISRGYYAGIDRIRLVRERVK